MYVSRSEGAKGGDSAHELDGLNFAAELQFQNVAQGYVVRGGQRKRLECSAVQIDIRGSQTAHRESHLRLGSIIHFVGVGSA